MRRLLLAASALATITYATPASATLQVAATFNGVSFFCADNTACDQNGAVGTLSLSNQLIGGVQVNGSIQTSAGTPGVPGPLDILNTSSLSVINTNAGTINGTFAVSDVNFAAPVGSIALSGAGTWQTAVGSSVTLGWYADTANGQGADNSTDHPGVLVGTFTSIPTLPADSLAFNGNTAFSATAPFSMTETAVFTLNSGAQLISRGQTMIASPVPEPATMLLLGAGLVGLAAVRRRT